MRERAHILAIDEGTTNAKAILVDGSGRIVAHGAHEVTPTFPRPGWVEQDPLALWQATRQAISDCLEQASGVSIDGLAITNQRESVVVWDRKTGDPVGPMIIWQCRRTAPFCEDLRRQGLEALVRRKSGLTIDPLFSASKARWLIDRAPDGQARAEAGELCVGTVDAWLLWQLSGGRTFRTDVSNASRTQLLNLEAARWDPDLLDLFGIPSAALPEVLASSALFGETVRVGALSSGIPIAGVAGDSHAALFGQVGFRPGSVKATYGTGSSLMTPVSRPVISGKSLSTTIAWGLAGSVTYALEGNITVTGAAVQWFQEFLGLASASDVAVLAASVESTDGVYLVPAFAGLGAPWWREDARGLVTGMTRGTRAAHVARAIIEAIAYQIRDVFDLMDAESENEARLLLADGGASRNDHLMQFQADILDRPVLRNSAADIAALGAATLAGLQLGVWQSLEEIEALPRKLDRFEPAMTASRRERLYEGWRRAIARAIGDEILPETYREERE